MPDIRIFPTARGEFESVDKLREWLDSALRRDGKYHLCPRKPGEPDPTPRIKAIDAGSVGLFRFHDEFIGEGVIASGVECGDFTDPANNLRYYQLAHFDPSSIRIYRQGIAVEPLGVTGKANAYQKMDWAFYGRLLAAVESGGGFQPNSK